MEALITFYLFLIMLAFMVRWAQEYGDWKVQQKGMPKYKNPPLPSVRNEQ